MQELVINTAIGKSKLLIGERLVNLDKYIPGKHAVIITDENVNRLYRDAFPKDTPVIVIGTGEKVKNMDTMSLIFDELIKYQVDRSAYIIGIGGGVVCDIAGFVASAYMRGVSFGFVSTTLLSQVDASTGGKNGVNFKGYKNMIGVFNQPDFVICDPEMLKTLPEEEYIAAYGEVIKHALIKDKALFEFLEENREKAMKRDKGVIQRVVYDSLVIKSAVVQEDEKENGLRRILNFGHTLGHAIERYTGIIHGKAVSIGMVMAAEISFAKGLIDKGTVERIKGLLIDYGLPVNIAFDKKEIIEIMKKDKKRAQSDINFVLLKSIGDVIIEPIAIKELEEIIYDMP
jgi:3-dehydroquinate synthase